METTTTATAMLIRRYLESFQGMGGTCLQDIIDEDIFEVLAGVAWVRDALAEASPKLPPEDQRDFLLGLKTLAA